MAAKKKAVKAVKKAVKATRQGRNNSVVVAREALFVEAYIANGGNASAAAGSAGFVGDMNTLKVTGCKVLARPHVKAAIEARQKELLDKHKLTADEVVASLARALRFDPSKMLNPDGSLKGMHELDADTIRAIGSFEITYVKVKGDGEDERWMPVIKKFKAVDQNAAREQGMKHFGLYKIDNKQRADAIVEMLAEIAGHDVGLPIKD